ncbi:uncharacterized protein LOC131309383 [Rhododendron vialii]|uniref:uncharacterized protein LOC131309383 n=1 Tax=Rhododendron vialii TaxID=182163 RepID=UPI00265F3AC0|nr:uncharacterized protein LOC131309383 [Rhododendron vialii]
MAEPGEGGGNGGVGGEENRPRGEIEAPRPQIDDQTTVRVSPSAGAGSTGGGGGSGGHAVEAGSGEGRRAPGSEGRTPSATGSVGPRVRRLDARGGVEGVVITGLGSAGAGSAGGGGSGDVGDDGGDGGRPGTPTRDPARGKAPVVEEGAPGEVPVEEVAFRPAVGSSVHVPITRGDFAEFVSEEELGWLLRENPGVVATVLAAREDRARQVERAQEEERLREEAERARAQEEAFESEAGAAEEAQGEVWSFERAVTLAESARLAPRRQFDAATYAPPEPHLFIPSGVESLAPLRESYDAELILRDPQRHLSVDWAQYASTLKLDLNDRTLEIIESTGRMLVTSTKMVSARLESTLSGFDLIGLSFELD